MSSSNNSISYGVALIDLKTYGDTEAFMYQTPHSNTLFVAAVECSNWFSIICSTISSCNSIISPVLGNCMSNDISKQNDYILHIWFRCKLPQIWIPNGSNYRTSSTLKWVQNIGHNIFKKIKFFSDGYPIQELDSYILDYLSQFDMKGGKVIGYNNMIGNINDNTRPVSMGDPCGFGTSILVPFPFWFSKDSGYALPMSSITRSKLSIECTFRKFSELIVIDPGFKPTKDNTINNIGPTINSIMVYDSSRSNATNSRDTPSSGSTPDLINPTLFYHSAVVADDERSMMTDAPRDMLIEQYQVVHTSIGKYGNKSESTCIKAGHAVKHIFVAFKNTSIQSYNSALGAEQSNYTTALYGMGGFNPIHHISILYENTYRFSNNSDYYTSIVPWYFCSSMPTNTGYHLISYALKPMTINPTESTNYNRLNDVSLNIKMSDAFFDSIHSSLPLANPSIPGGSKRLLEYRTGDTGETINLPQNYKLIVRVCNHNIIRIQDGILLVPIQ